MNTFVRGMPLQRAAAMAWRHFGGGDIEAAAALAAEVLAVAPDHAAMLHLCGQLAGQRGRLADAEAFFRRALAVGGDDAGLFSDLGFALAKLHRYAEAEAAFRRAISLAPTLAAARNNLANLLLDAGRVAEALENYEALSRMSPGHCAARHNTLLGLNYLAEPDRESIWRAHRRLGAGFDRPAPVRLRDPDPGRRLRVAYVGSDFRMHPVGYFMSGVFAAHDPARVEVIIVSCSPRADGLTAFLRTRVAGWIDGFRFGDDELAAVLRQHRIDVLVDLAGHTEGNRLPVFGMTPAPVQFSYLGYANTTGMTSIGWRVADEATEPVADECFSSEKILRIADGYFCYTPPPDAHAIPVAPPPVVRQGVVTFGASPHLGKMTDRTVDLWARVLAALPTARLLIAAHGFVDGAIRAGVAARFAARGVAPERLLLRGPLSYADNLRRYAEVDIGLDTFPFNLATNTCEALWMGVPVVSLTGDRHVSRLGLSILRSAGLAELACSTPEAFVARCVALAAADLTSLRLGMRQRLSASPLTDARRVAAGLEAAYRHAWRLACADEKR